MSLQKREIKDFLQAGTSAFSVRSSLFFLSAILAYKDDSWVFLDKVGSAVRLTATLGI